MRVTIEQEDFCFSPPLTEPLWSSKVPRWYQLDGPAFALTELFFQQRRDMDLLILASPMASNLTDFEFVQSGAIHAQKFVHTLPNIRASMALKAVDHACDCLCLQNGPKTRESAFIEFISSAQFKARPSLAVVDLLEIDECGQNRQVYRTTLISASEDGGWEIQPTTPSESSEFENVWSQNLFASKKSFQMGPWNWEKLN